MKRILLIMFIAAIILFGAVGCAPRTPPPSSPPESVAYEPEEPEDTGPSPYTILTLTVPEGWTLARIALTLEEMGFCTVQEFINAAQNGDYSDFPLVAAQIPNPNRCFVLEGYLFPDTYQFYLSDTPETLIRKMLANLENKITDALRIAIEDSGYTVDEILTLASIIEKEAFGPQYMPEISSVLHNRLGIGMMLQCDVTIIYVEGAIKPFIDGDVNRYNDFYNTYKAPGIPAGAICNPGLDAIRAALFPAETDYFYFITDEDSNYHFTETWEGHVENVQKYLS